MADLNDTNSAQTIKIVGSDSVGVETTPVGSTSTGALKVSTSTEDVSFVSQNITARDVASTTTLGANSQTIITGTPTVGSVSSFTLSSQNTVKMIVTGVWTGTLSVEQSIDGGTTWARVGLHQTGTAYTTNDFTSNFIGAQSCSAATNVRIRATTAWTGTAVVKVIATLNDNSTYIANGLNIQDFNNPTNKLTIKSTASAATLTDQAAVVALSPTSPIQFDTADKAIYGGLITSKRLNQIEVDFSTSGAVASRFNTVTSGTGTNTLSNGLLTLSTGTGTTALAKGTSFNRTTYVVGHEIFACFSVTFTTPTSVNSYQRVGLYDDTDGFYIGYNGTTFGVTRRSAGVETFIPRSAWDDQLTGTTGSFFQRSEVAEAIDFTKTNVYRIRFGWYGGGEIIFEVYSPDGKWVIFHKIRFPNSSTGTSVQNPNLPLRGEVSKTSADAVSLSVTSGAWVAGTTGEELPAVGPNGTVRQSGYGSVLKDIDFDSGELDFQTDWLLPITNNSGDYSITNGILSLNVATTASRAISITSIEEFQSPGTAQLQLNFLAKIEANLVSNNYRFFGVGTYTSALNSSTPPVNAIGYEITTAGLLNAVIYASSIKVFSQQLTPPTNATINSFSIDYNQENVYFLINSKTYAQASAKYLSSDKASLPLLVLSINSASSPSSSPILDIKSIHLMDSTNNGLSVENTSVTDNYSEFFPSPTNHKQGTANIATDGSGQLVTRSTVLTDEGSFRDDFSGTIFTTLTGTCQFINGKSVIIGTGTSFKNEVLVNDYIKKVSDGEANYARVVEVSSDTRLIIEGPYQGTTATGQAYGTAQWKTVTGTGSVSLSNSILSLSSGTASGSKTYLSRDGDYPAYNLLFKANLSQRIANQTTILGFVDDVTNIGCQASFQFTGTDNTKVTCVSSFSGLSGDSQSTTITLPSGALTSAYNVYQIDVTSQDVAFSINGKLVARHTEHLPNPYQSLNFISYMTNSAVVTTTTLNCDYVYFSNLDRLQIANDFTGDPLKASIMGISSVSGLPVDLNLDATGNLIVTSLTGFGADFTFGDVTTAASTQVVVRRTAYTEQTTNGQRSIASASANDTAAGTGARTVQIIYLDSTGAGPFTETLTLNGTTGVNTVSTNICYIEEIKVLTVGSGGSNAGIITLYTAINKGGTTIGTINAADNQTFWCHHYIPNGKVCNITGVSTSHNGTTVGSGAVFLIKTLSIGIANAVESQATDFIRLYGQSSTFSRTYTSPIKVVGPARLVTYVTPETTSSTVYRSAIDFFEP